jgi:putative colanic acid biosynthesis UDP-glucose lipid carrier transferase
MNNTHTGSVLYYEKAKPVSFQQQNYRLSKLSLIGKRSFDIIFSIFVIIFLLSWLLPILSILIIVNSRGPVFFVQKRTGRNGKTFNCLKLRTMVVNAQANQLQARNNDPRITKVGKFLRLSCLDELPQFFNVLIGDMSIVGPRPHMISDCKKFSKVVKDYNDRNMVKPGITGMAQVKGFRGETNGYYDIFHRYKWDMFYVRNAGFRLDMRIIRLTITYTFSTIISKYLQKLRKEQTTTYLFEPLEAKEYLN